tara:strand:+ start:219 stop:527 length:309 start_codon:yes stop_codon:yes gene_type:complete
MSKKKKSGKGKTKGKKYGKFKNMLNKVSGRPASAEYMKYKDLSKSDVHEGDATYRGVTKTDSSGTNITQYRTNVLRGHSKNYFRFQGDLYKITPSGYEQITI